MRASFFVAFFVAASSAAIAPFSIAEAQELTEARRIRLAHTLTASTVSVITPGYGGSGFVVGPERWIITNYHVVERLVTGAIPGLERSGTLVVRFRSGTQFSAHVIATDPGVDLALLEVEGGHVPAPPLELADSDRVVVGQRVLAMGDPFGLEGTLTEGIVSARRDLDRRRHGVRTRQYIQTDAVGGPGSSGGPLVDARGRVVGVTTLGRNGVLGIEYATPANYVSELLESARAARDGSAPHRNGELVAAP